MLGTQYTDRHVIVHLQIGVVIKYVIVTVFLSSKAVMLTGHQSCAGVQAGWGQALAAQAPQLHRQWRSTVLW